MTETIQRLLNNSRLFLILGVLGTGGIAAGVVFKLLHLQGTIVIMDIGMILFTLFGIWTLAKVYFSKINFEYKLLWMLGMVLAPVIVMWVYHIKNKEI
jgi:hypothetical protein